MTPYQRTKKLLESNGWRTGRLERWIPYSADDPRKQIKPGQKEDLWGIADMIAINPILQQTCLIQICGADVSPHLKKLELPEKKQAIIDWLKSGVSNGFWLIGWRKLKKVRGGKAMIWKERLFLYELSDDQLTIEITEGRSFMLAVNDPKITQIILNIDSPGGMVTGINEFQDMIRSASNQNNENKIA